MSFRKRARPAIALSSLSRSRQAKGSENDESRGSNTEVPKIETGNNAVATCGESRDMPGTKEGKELKDHLEEVVCPKSTDIILKSDSVGSKINSDGPLKTIQSKRFKRFRPSVSNNSRAKQLAFKETEEHVLQMEEGSSSYFGAGVEQSSDKLTADFCCTNDYPILVDDLSKLDNNAQSFTANVVAGQKNDAGCSLSSKSSCSATTGSDLNENQTGFAVTASSITSSEPNEEEIQHTNTFLISKESGSDVKPIVGPSTELSDKNPKSVSPSNWTRKRKISPCLSRAGRKSDSKIGAMCRKSDDIHKSDKMDILEDVHVHKEDIVLTKTESTDLLSRISDPGVAKLQEGSTSLSQNVANTKFLDTSSSVDCEIKERLPSKPIKGGLYVDFATYDGDDSFSSNVTNLDVSIENNEIVGRKSDISELEVKKSKRVRFKPNIVAKCRRSSPKTSRCSSSFKEELNTSFEAPNEENLPPVLENIDVEHQQTPFNQQAIQNGALVAEFDKLESSSAIENGHKGTVLQNSYQNATHLGRYSDTEDGSQSEGEGIQHHKRKFTPYLGPKVRQRKRSVTLFEDDGHMSDRSQKDSNFENNTDRETHTGLEKNDTSKEHVSSTKKQKRKRIVIKEPKEKMTMFDYIYYNPKSSDTKEAENGKEKKQGKRSNEESTEPGESEFVLGSIHGGDSNSCTALSFHGDEVQEEEELGEKEVIAPQIKIGEDGQIVVDEESLVLKTTRSKISLETSEIVYTDGFDPYQRKQGPRKKKRWTIDETLKFYTVLSSIGTDFSLMMKYFPGCPRSVLKKKFKNEEKFNGDLIDRALKNMLPMNDALLEELQNATEHAKSQKLTGSSNANIERRNLVPKRSSSQVPLANANRIQNSLAREEAIVQEEIFTMEVADNVTI